MDTCSSARLPFYKFPYPESVLHGGWQRKCMKTGSRGDITRIPRLELFSILKVLFPHKTGGKEWNHICSEFLLIFKRSSS